MIAPMIHQKINAAYASIKMETPQGERYRTNGPDLQLLGMGNYIDLNVFVVRKDILQKTGYFDDELRGTVDYDLIWRITKATELQFFPFVGVNYTHHDDIQRITNTELLTWGGVVKNKNLIDWNKVGDKRKKGASIVLAVKDDSAAIRRNLSALVHNTPLDELREVVVVDAAASPATNSLLTSLTLIWSKITYIRSAESSDLALASNIGFANTTAERIIFLQEGTEVEPGWHEALINPRVESAKLVAPTHLYPNRTVYSAGLVFPDPAHKAFPVSFLRHHPAEDLSKLPKTYAVPSVVDGCVAVAAKLFTEFKGFSPLFDNGFETMDLAARINQNYPGSVYTSKESQVVNHHNRRGWINRNYTTFLDKWSGVPMADGEDLWKAAGFKVTGYNTDAQAHTVEKVLAPVLKKTDNRLRWAIKISSPADKSRFEWGDTYFAEALQQAIVRLGHEAVVDNRSSHVRPTSYLDDVVLTIQGLVPVEPQPGKINMLWVISHPEKITDKELKSYDIVYSAGVKWAEDAARRSGRLVNTLLQCTDATMFVPPKSIKPEFQDAILFVGNSRNVFRPIVRDSIDASLDLSVIGGRWEQYIDKKYIKHQLIANKDLPAAYGSSKIVLNDHWDDMRAWGFYSNRLFDASATGVPIISDNIEGAEKIFRGLVYCYKDTADLKQVVANYDDVFPPKEERLAIAAEIKRLHSFDARAEKLVRDAVEALTKHN
jgi:hypothetical protein